MANRYKYKPFLIDEDEPKYIKVAKAVGTLIGSIIAIVLIDMFIAWIVWLMYSSVAPIFHWPQAPYWAVFSLLIILNTVYKFMKS